jgi:hypothetical protein
MVSLVISKGATGYSSHKFILFSRIMYNNIYLNPIFWYKCIKQRNSRTQLITSQIAVYLGTSYALYKWCNSLFFLRIFWYCYLNRLELWQIWIWTKNSKYTESHVQHGKRNEGDEMYICASVSGMFWGVYMLEKNGDQLDRSCEKWRSITQSEGGEKYRTYSKKKKG